MKYLVDANVLSEATKTAPHPEVIAWLTIHEREVCVDPIILGELGFGIRILQAGQKRTRLEKWFDAVSKNVACVPWDVATGLRWARLMADLRKRGTAMPLLDSMIAATALANDLVVVSSNSSDFDKAKVEVLNPFLL
jgi:predicted nucleic acid-binding protein